MAEKGSEKVVQNAIKFVEGSSKNNLKPTH